MRMNNLFCKTLSTWCGNLRQMTRAGVMFVLAVSFALPATSAVAQTAGDGAITGTVKDASGAVVGNATVTARNASTGVKPRALLRRPAFIKSARSL